MSTLHLLNQNFWRSMQTSGFFFVCLFVFAVRGPLTVVASSVAEHTLRTPRLSFGPGLPDYRACSVSFFLWYAGLSLLWSLPLRSTGSRRTGSAAMAHGPSRSAACGIFLDQGTNPCPLHRQADSQPLRHQGSPTVCLVF